MTHTKEPPEFPGRFSGELARNYLSLLSLASIVDWESL